MARRKDAMALFEIISKHRDKRTQPKVAVPKWMQRREPDEAAEETPPPDAAPEADVQEPPAQPPPQPQEQEPPDTQPPEEVPEPTPPTKPTPPIVDAELVPEAEATAPGAETEAEGKGKCLVIEDGHVKVSLSYIGAGVAVTGVLVLLLGAFLVGRQTASGVRTASLGPEDLRPPTKRDRDATKKGPAQGPPAKVAKDAKKPAPTTGALQKGKFYLVIQHLRGSERDVRDDGGKIVKFCTANGVPAKIMQKRQSSGKVLYWIWSLQPFDNANPTNPAALLHAEKIDALGERYFRQYGKYRLTQRENGAIKLWLMKY